MRNLIEQYMTMYEQIFLSRTCGSFSRLNFPLKGVRHFFHVSQLRQPLPGLVCVALLRMITYSNFEKNEAHTTIYSQQYGGSPANEIVFDVLNLTCFIRTAANRFRLHFFHERVETYFAKLKYDD